MPIKNVTTENRTRFGSIPRPPCTRLDRGASVDVRLQKTIWNDPVNNEPRSWRKAPGATLSKLVEAHGP